MSDPALELAEVHFRHPGASGDAVSGARLRMDPGEIVGVVGPNAAGKSTLARLAAMLLVPSSGLVRLAGVPLIDLLPLTAGPLVRAAVGGDERAVQDEVGRPCSTALSRASRK